MRNVLLSLAGVLAALWMGFGRFLFGIGGELTWWYAPLIALPYLVLHLFTQQRLNLADRRGTPAGKATYLALLTSWVCAIGFGFTVPDLVNGDLVSAWSHLAGPAALGMSIAVCNPFGIIALTTVIITLGYAAAAGRPKRLSEDEMLDAAEAAGVDLTQIAPHPLAVQPEQREGEGR